jgi:hypothetical protein
MDTKAGPDVERARALVALDWLIREYLPAWLDLVPALAGQAEALRSLPAVADMATAKAAGVTVRTIREEAERLARLANDGIDARICHSLADEAGGISRSSLINVWSYRRCADDL